MSDHDHVPSRTILGRADAVLAAFSEENPTASLGGLVARTGLPKTTVHRTVEKMVELGWLSQDHDRYSVGIRLFEIASLSRLRTNLREVALPYMGDLYEATHETIHLAVREGSQVLYAEKLSGHRPVTLLSRVGGRMPLHCTAVGKTLLAYAAPRFVDATPAAPLARRTASTITSPARLRSELERIRADGVAYDREECDRDVVCVASPILAPDGDCAAALSITGSAQRLRLDRLSPAVHTAALAVSRALRHRWEEHPDVRPPR